MCSLQNWSNNEGHHELELRDEILVVLVTEVPKVGDAGGEEIEDGKIGQEVSDELLVPCLSVAGELLYSPYLFGN